MLSRFVVSQVKHNSYFLVGVVLGLWVALVAVPLEDEPAVASCAGAASPELQAADEYEPQREERPLGPAGQAAGRSVQRPRYYSTELGMRGSLLAGVLSSEEFLENRIAALNQTVASLHPAFRIFIAASAPQAAKGHANVVGFTDSREMLKPFHALKYLADNYLEEYDFFFLISDTSFVNARRLKELVSKLSVSQDVYMGTIAEDDSHYCSLEGGILLSNSVLRAVHNELDWCVRNSYSPRHHENIGRCVLHAAHQHCTDTLQGEQYSSVVLQSAEELPPALAAAVSAHPAPDPRRLYQLHAYVSRMHLERNAAETERLRASLAGGLARHPRGYRNASWPAGLRADPGLQPPPPDNRFDHLRWTLFNASHAFMPDDHRALAPLAGATKEAVELVLKTARAWSLQRWPDAGDVQLVEGAWRWEPATALRYRLLLRLAPRPDSALTRPTVRLVEVARTLGAARLVPAPYVTETARLHVVLPAYMPHAAARAGETGDLAAYLRRYKAVALAQDKNTALIVVIVKSGDSPSAEEAAAVSAAREAVAGLRAQYAGALLTAIETALGERARAATGPRRADALQRRALEAALPHLPRDGLTLLMPPHAEFNQDFLNRVRMNTIMNEQWYLAGAFARYSQYSHPRFVEPDGGRPQQHTGRFNLHRRAVLACYRRDYDAALAEWTGSELSSPAEVLAASPLRCLHAPDPALVLTPRPAPCAPAPPAGPSADGACLRAHRDDHFRLLDLGDRFALARLLLEEQAAKS